MNEIYTIELTGKQVFGIVCALSLLRRGCLPNIPKGLTNLANQFTNAAQRASAPDILTQPLMPFHTTEGE